MSVCSNLEITSKIFKEEGNQFVESIVTGGVTYLYHLTLKKKLECGGNNKQLRESNKFQDCGVQKVSSASE
jgi:hypothetical protein